MKDVAPRTVRHPIPGKSLWWLIGACAAGIAVPALIGGASALAAYYPIGRGLPENGLFRLTGSLALVPLAAGLILAAGILYSVLARSWRPVGLCVIVCTLMIPGLFVTIFIHVVLRIPAFHLLAGRSAPLVAAIDAYEREIGAPPGSLADLVPKYLDEIPATGMSTYPHYGYSLGAGYCESGNAWSIAVQVGDLLNWDMFFYCPNQDYPAKLGSDPIERIGTWAYLHE